MEKWMGPARVESLATCDQAQAFAKKVLDGWDGLAASGEDLERIERAQGLALQALAWRLGAIFESAPLLEEIEARLDEVFAPTMATMATSGGREIWTVEGMSIAGECAAPAEVAKVACAPAFAGGSRAASLAQSCLNENPRWLNEVLTASQGRSVFFERPEGPIFRGFLDWLRPLFPPGGFEAWERAELGAQTAKTKPLGRVRL